PPRHSTLTPDVPTALAAGAAAGTPDEPGSWPSSSAMTRRPGPPSMRRDYTIMRRSGWGAAAAPGQVIAFGRPSQLGLDRYLRMACFWSYAAQRVAFLSSCARRVRRRMALA